MGGSGGPKGVIGNAAEDQALAYLQSQGLRMRERNYRCRSGELDLVMEEGETLVFVEVRFRRDRRFGGAAASIDGHKQARLWRTAQHYLQQQRLERRPCRFDMVLMDPQGIEWLRNALQPEF